MESLKIEVLNPEAKKLLEDLEALKLIKIEKEEKPERGFQELLKKLRSNADQAPSLDEITKEVEAVRKERYEASKGNT